ncbi:PREDICTED: folate transporter 1-like [Diuraphis noxia]|uniref:folate transporter 1-like n=1 Tax=Diuraphis noxia TaxID=143948 RepID=UPI0007639FD0|nr:PREDICTED: folate transporter 1-like [Diuraphis noxia]
MAYYGYLYSKIEDKEHYQIATGFAKSGMLSGTCVGGLLGQLVVYFNDRNYSVLPYYSLAFVTFATAWACFLPSVGNSKTFVHTQDVRGKVFSNATIRDPGISKYSSTEKADTPNVSTQVTFADDDVWSKWYCFSLKTTIIFSPETIINI